ncbi:hypothetical protein C4565_09370 [Candidatus Parcubacteria bacterium]|jgi:hypothetical protein|nr:MAG: hypothetical protein C4565_09370 [Candidatus Parcubacteria bacterium]
MAHKEKRDQEIPCLFRLNPPWRSAALFLILSIHERSNRGYPYFPASLLPFRYQTGLPGSYATFKPFSDAAATLDD